MENIYLNQEKDQDQKFKKSDSTILDLEKAKPIQLQQFLRIARQLADQQKNLVVKNSDKPPEGCCYIYVMLVGVDCGETCLVKIGQTKRNPKIRAKEIQRQMRGPFEVVFVFAFLVGYSAKADSTLHQILQKQIPCSKIFPTNGDHTFREFYCFTEEFRKKFWDLVRTYLEQYEGPQSPFSSLKQLIKDKESVQEDVGVIEQLDGWALGTNNSENNEEIQPSQDQKFQNKAQEAADLSKIPQNSQKEPQKIEQGQPNQQIIQIIQAYFSMVQKNMDLNEYILNQNTQILDSIERQTAQLTRLIDGLLI